MWRRVLLAALLPAIAACGGTGVDGRSDTNGGIVSIPRTSDYTYVLHSGCVGLDEFRLQNDSGYSVWIPLADSGGLPQKGTIRLAAGSWKGQWFFKRLDGTMAEALCSWDLRLAA